MAEIRDAHAGEQTEITPAAHVDEPAAARVGDLEPERRRRRLGDVTLEIAYEHPCRDGAAVAGATERRLAAALRTTAGAAHAERG